MYESILLPYAKTLTTIELPLGGCYLLAKCSFFYEGPAEKYSVGLPRQHSSISVTEITGWDSADQVCGKLVAMLAPLKRQPAKKGESPVGAEYWRAFSRDEVLEFSRITNDKNPIHFQNQPVVQGLLIFSQLLQLVGGTKTEIRFFSPLYADEKVWLLKEKETLTGFAQDRRCFHFKL